MGATSVTGKGLGSADKRQKGSEHLRIGSEKIIGPRVVYAGAITLDSSGDGTVVLPLLAGSASNYVVQVTHRDTTTPAAIAATLAFSSNASTVTVKGAASDGVYVTVMKAGLAV